MIRAANTRTTAPGADSPSTCSFRTNTAAASCKHETNQNEADIRNWNKEISGTKSQATDIQFKATDALKSERGLFRTSLISSDSCNTGWLEDEGSSRVGTRQRFKWTMPWNLFLPYLFFGWISFGHKEIILGTSSSLGWEFVICQLCSFMTKCLKYKTATMGRINCNKKVNQIMRWWLHTGDITAGVQCLAQGPFGLWSSQGLNQ